MSVTVTECKYLKEWSANGRSGKVYTITLSDNTTGQSYGEIPIGTPKEDLEITPNGNYPSKIKLIKKNGFAGGGIKKSTNESFALSYAKDLIVAMLPKMEKQPTSGELAKVVVATAEVFYTWLEGKKK